MIKLLLILLMLAPAVVHSQGPQTLDGRGSSDPDGSIVAWQWRQISGPNSCVITNSQSAVATVLPAVWLVGTYVFELEVTDNAGAKSTDRMSIVVSPNPDVPPIVQAGGDQTVQGSKVTLTGSGTDANGNNTINLILWSLIGGPNVPVITSPGAFVTDVNGLVPGVYSFRLKLGRVGGASAADTVKVTVAAANQVPVVNAGPDQTIILPVSSVTIGKFGDPTLAIRWVRVSGPTSVTFETPTLAVTRVSGLTKPGVYEFEKIGRTLTGVTNTDRVVITVRKCTWLYRLFGWCPKAS